MSLIVAAAATMAMTPPVAAQQQPSRATIAPPDMHWVAPGLATYTDEMLFGEVWKRADLNPRDRSLVTLSALIAGGHSAQLTNHLNRALDNGIKPNEIGGIITHLAFYSGWPNAVSALGTARTVLESRGILQAEMELPPQAPTATGSAFGIARKGSHPVTTGLAANFTGAVRVSAPFRGMAGSNIGGATVTFEPGARSAWHRHAKGQTLVVTEGCGWVQNETSSIEKVCAGDVVSVGPGVKHWHGATSHSAMSHVAMSESSDVEWLEQVSDASYSRGPR